MIRIDSPIPVPRDPIPTLVVGVGGAGCNVLDRMVLDGFDKTGLLAANTDVQTLSASVAGKKLQIGAGLTRGLGTGGDPDLGYDAANEMQSEIAEALEGARLVFLCAGLGGGTGSGVSPVIARIAREQGALVIAFVTLPFGFEGNRRISQATRGLELLRAETDAVVCFENDRMAETVSARAGIHEAFAAADSIVSQSIRAIADLAGRPGLISIGLDDLFTALRRSDARCVFGHGEAEGDNAGHEALARALKNPLMDRGTLLAEARGVLVNISGGPQLTLAETQSVMIELGRHLGEHSHVLFGATVDRRLSGKVCVTILSSVGGEIAEHPAPAEDRPRIELPPLAEPQETPVAKPQQEIFLSAESDPPPAAAPPQAVPVEPAVPPAPETAPSGPASEEGEPAPGKPKKKAAPRQEDFQFEPVTRGRFEKSEPTIVEGEDLDVPTFLRKNVRLK